MPVLQLNVHSHCSCVHSKKRENYLKYQWIPDSEICDHLGIMQGLILQSFEGRSNVLRYVLHAKYIDYVSNSVRFTLNLNLPLSI